jgi:hypothetical protein
MGRLCDNRKSRYSSAAPAADNDPDGKKLKATPIQRTPANPTCSSPSSPSEIVQALADRLSLADISALVDVISGPQQAAAFHVFATRSSTPPPSSLPRDHTSRSPIQGIHIAGSRLPNTSPATDNGRFCSALRDFDTPTHLEFSYSPLISASESTNPSQMTSCTAPLNLVLRSDTTRRRTRSRKCGSNLILSLLSHSMTRLLYWLMFRSFCGWLIRRADADGGMRQSEETEEGFCPDGVEEVGPLQRILSLHTSSCVKPHPALGTRL